jgi:hypothetical protein
MKKVLLILACGFLVMFSISEAPAAMSNEGQTGAEWRADKDEISVIGIERTRDMYFPAMTTMQGLYIEWSGIVGWPRKTFAPGEDVAFAIHASIAVAGWTTWEWAVWRDGLLVFYGTVDFDLTVGDWKLTAPITIPMAAPPGNYEWSARVMDAGGHSSAYPVYLPIVIDIP